MPGVDPPGHAQVAEANLQGAVETVGTAFNSVTGELRRRSLWPVCQGLRLRSNEQDWRFA